MTVNELQNLTPEQLDELKSNPAEMREVLKSMQKAVSSRVNRLRSSGQEYSPALSKLRESARPTSSTDLISARADLSPEEQERELLRGFKFLNDKASTVGGFRELKHERDIALGNAPTTLDMERAMWGAYNRILESPELKRIVYEELDSDMFQRDLRKFVFDNNITDVDYLIQWGTDYIRSLGSSIQQDYSAEFYSLG